MSREHDESDPSEERDRAPESSESVRLARRRLLQLGAYVPPLVISSLVLSRDALAQTGPSCCPQVSPPNPNDPLCRR